MTDSQIKYQSLREEQRHNYAMERYNDLQAKAALQNAQSKANEVETKRFEALSDYYYRGKELKLTALHYSNETKLNARKAGAAIASTFFGGLGTVAALIG